MSRKKVDWATYHNRHSSKSIWVTRLLFCQKDSPMGESFWQKDSLITHILFELCLLWYLAQSTFILDTLYLESVNTQWLGFAIWSGLAYVQFQKKLAFNQTLTMYYGKVGVFLLLKQFRPHYQRMFNLVCTVWKYCLKYKPQTT